MILLTSFASSLTLYTGVPLDNTYENTYTTTSLLSGFTHDTIGVDYYRIRPDKNTVKIKHNGNMNVTGIGGVTLNLYNCNYMSFINSQHEGKRFYCFITDVRYISDVAAEIDFEIDVMMTWLKHGTGTTGAEFDTCFIEREHVLDDTIGKHILDEGLEFGDYVQHLNDYQQTMLLCCAINGIYKKDNITQLCGWEDLYAKYYTYNGFKIVSGVWYLWFDSNGTKAEPISGESNPFNTVNELVEKLVDWERSDWLSSIKYVPSGDDTIIVNRPDKLDGYKPNNNKMFTYPYVGCLVSNFDGINSIYPFEFSDYATQIHFEIVHDIMFGCSTLFPSNYNKGTNLNSIAKNNYPILSSASTEYNAVLGVQKARLASDIGNTIVSSAQSTFVGGGFEYGAVGGAASLLSTAFNRMSERSIAKLKPNTPNGSVQNLNVLNNSLYKFGIYDFTIKKEYAKSIDDFFTKFGYKVNRLGKPSFDAANMRLDWKYIKTIGCALNGECPSSAQSKICQIMDNGITFWKKAQIGAYTFPTE